MARWGWFAVAAAAIACGSGTEQQDDAGLESCSPTTCAALGKDCGSVPDGCGGTLSCGGCASGLSCGGAGTPNVCGSLSTCQPATCAASGKTCGAISDGCGGTVECGECPAGEACGAGGLPNVCGVIATCTPVTCAAQQKTCGTIPDGCGGALACGDCTGAGQTCGGGGTPNVCGVPPPVVPVRWAVRVGGPGHDWILGVDVDGEGNRYVLLYTQGAYVANGYLTGSSLQLRRFDATGNALGSRSWTFDGWSTDFRLAVAPSGDVLISAYAGCQGTGCPRGIDFGAGPIQYSALVGLDADGDLRWQRDLSGWPSALSVDGSGAALLVQSRWTVERIAPDGRLVWSRTANAEVCTADEQGNAFCATMVLSGPPSAIRIQELAAADGTVVWTRDVTGPGRIASVAAHASGSVAVLAVRGGDVEFAGTTVTDGGLVLLGLDGAGKPLWARGVEELQSPALAVHPSGRVVVAGRPQACWSVALHAYARTGDELWERTLPTDGSCAAPVELGGMVAGSADELTLGAWFSGPIHVGGERMQPEGTDGLLVVMVP
jgi:hypothetical protein